MSDDGRDFDEAMDAEGKLRTQMRVLQGQVHALGEANERHAQEVGALRLELRELFSDNRALSRRVAELEAEREAVVT